MKLMLPTVYLFATLSVDSKKEGIFLFPQTVVDSSAIWWFPACSLFEVWIRPEAKLPKGAQDSVWAQALKEFQCLKVRVAVVTVEKVTVDVEVLKEIIVNFCA